MGDSGLCHGLESDLASASTPLSWHRTRFGSDLFASKCWKDGGGVGRAWELESASLPNERSLNKVADKGVCPGTGLLYCFVYQI